MVCTNCGKNPAEFKDEKQYQRHLSHCGAGITYDLKIMGRLRNQANNTDKEKGLEGTTQ